LNFNVISQAAFKGVQGGAERILLEEQQFGSDRLTLFQRRQRIRTEELGLREAQNS